MHVSKNVHTFPLYFSEAKDVTYMIDDKHLPNNMSKQVLKRKDTTSRGNFFLNKKIQQLTFAESKIK